MTESQTKLPQVVFHRSTCVVFEVSWPLAFRR